jgi:hypothetical protein
VKGSFDDEPCGDCIRWRRKFEEWEKHMKEDRANDEAARLEKYKNADPGRTCKVCGIYKDKYNYSVVSKRSNGTRGLSTTCYTCLKVARDKKKG